MSRKLAQLGGTTTAGDVRVAAGLIARGVDARPEALEHYERGFATAAGVRHATSFATGRVGLYGLLLALGVGEGDEVLLQAPTHVVVPNAIRYAGAMPVYADCLAGNWNIDLDSAASRVTPRTRVLLLQHTFGIPAEMDRVRGFVREHDLILIEDCVHSLGARWKGTPTGAFGRAAFFSTEETKMISTTMGGMVVTDDAELHGKLRRFADRCSPPPRSLTSRYLLKLIAYHLLTEPRVHRWARAAYEAAGERQPLPTPTQHVELEGGHRTGYEQRLSAAQAVLGSRQLSRLDANLAHRRATAELYRRSLAADNCTLPAVPEGAEPSWVRYPVRVADRDAAIASLRPHAVAGTWFTSVLEEAVDPAVGCYETGSCPVAEDAARHLINLPTHPRVRPDDAERIADAVLRAAS